MDDLSHIPDDLRCGYILLKNAGVLPEEMELKKEIVSLQSS
nr:DnaJ family domain-containing protein [Desulforamulus aquiferis]